MILQSITLVHMGSCIGSLSLSHFNGYSHTYSVFHMIVLLMYFTSVDCMQYRSLVT